MFVVVSFVLADVTDATSGLLIKRLIPVFEIEPADELKLCLLRFRCGNVKSNASLSR